MRTISILAGGALLGLAGGAMAADPAPAPAPMTPPPAASAGAPYAAPEGYQPGPAPYAYAQPPMGPRGHMDRHGYHEPQRGAAIGDVWRDPAYAVQDWQAWGLTPPGYGMHWMRYYDDAVLVDGYGRVVDVRPGVNWNGPRPGPMPGMGPGGPGYGAPGYAWHDGHGGTTVYHAGPNTTVTTQVIGGAPVPLAPGFAYGGGYGGYGYGYGGGYAVGAGTLIITPGSVVTTTTTTSEETVYHSARRRAWRAPVRHYHRRCLPKAPACPVEAPVVGS